jgi:outer membrane protein assembly factor BamB
MKRRWRKVYIFVSSTFTDMHGERDFLVKRVFPSLADWCERRQLRLVDVDLRWGVTEQDATFNRKVVDVCLRHIDECRPFFICFLGQRYGWVPRLEDLSCETLESFPGLRDAIREGASVTELEVLHAIVGPFGATGGSQLSTDAAVFFTRDGSWLDDLPADPACLRRMYSDEYEPVAAARELLLGRMKRLKDRIEQATRRTPFCYSARWNASAATPELELPLESPSDLEATAQRWRAQWLECAGIAVPGTDFAVPKADRGRAADFNRRLMSGRLAGFECESRKLEDVLLNALCGAIESRYPENVEGAPTDELQAELDQHEQFLFDCSEEFFSRGDDFAALDAHFAGNDPRPLVLAGAGGTGKSTLLAAWLYERRAAEHSVEGLTFHFRFIGAGQGSATVFLLLHSIAMELARDGKLQGPVPANPDQLRAQFPQILDAAGKKGRTVLVLDGLNQLESGLSDLGWLPRKLPDSVRLIVSLRSDAPGAAEFLERSGQSDRMSIQQLQPFTDAEHRRMLVNAYLARHLKQLDDRQVDALVSGKGAENPLYLKVVLSELRVFGSFSGLWSQIRGAFGNTPESAFDAMLQRLETETAYAAIHSGIAVPELFGLLAHARSGLTVGDLGELLAAAAGPQTTQEQACDTALQYLREVRPFLARREGKYDFFYESMRNAAVVRAHRYREAADWHRLLAAYFRRQSTGPGSWDPSARRALADLPYHIRCAGDLDDLFALYSDMEYLDARCRSLAVNAAFLENEPLEDDENWQSLGVLEMLDELHQAVAPLTHHDRGMGEALGAIVQLLTERQPLVARFPEHALQEIGNYLRWYSRSERTLAIEARARRMPAGLGLRHCAIGEGSQGHNTKITALACTQSGREFLSGALDGTVAYWGIGEDHPRWVLPAHEEHVTSIAFSPDGRQALSAGEDGGLLLWNLELGTHRIYRPLSKHCSVAWAGGFLDAETALAATAGVLFTFDLATGSILWRESIDTTKVVRSPDRKWVLYGHTGGKPPYGIWVVAVGGGDRVHVGDLARPPDEVLFGQDNETVFAVDYQGYVYAFDRRGGALDETTLGCALASWCAAPGGGAVAGDRLGAVHRISRPPAMRVRTSPEQAWNFRPATAMASQTEHRILAGREDGSIDLVYLETNTLAKSWPAAENLIAAALLDPAHAAGLSGTRLQGEYILGHGPYAVSGGKRSSAPKQEPHSNFVTGVAALGGGTVLTVDRGGSAVLWRHGKIERVHRTGLDMTCCGPWLEGGIGVAGTSGDLVCLIGRGPQIVRMPLLEQYQAPGVSAVAAAGKPVQVIAALHNSEVASAGRRTWREKSRSGMGTAAAIDADGRLAATGHGFGKVHIWNAKTGEELWRIALHVGPVYALAFGGDGLLYSAGADRCLIVLDPVARRVVTATQLAYPGIALLLSQGGGVSACDTSGTIYLFGPDGFRTESAPSAEPGWLRFFRRFSRKETR